MYGKGRELEIGNATSEAATELGPHNYTAPVKSAIGIILDDVLPKFPENGGD